jgi:hypothetical protein
MIIHPALRALRVDDRPQRLAQDRMVNAIQAWREDPENAPVLADVAAFATSRPLAACPALSALFEEGDDAARRFAGSFMRATADTLSAEPLGHVALRHFTDGTLSTLQLAREGNVSLSLVATDGAELARRPSPVTADFGPRECWETVLAGEGEAELIECRAVDDQGKADLRRRVIALHPGKVICRDADRQSLQVRTVSGCLVSLRLLRRREHAGVTREFALGDGMMVHQAAANPRDSRIELMLALLGRMNRTDAAPLMAELAVGSGTAGLRWQALRECLALDTQAGFAALQSLAGRETDDLLVPARSLRDQLLAAYPQLSGIQPCPAQ